MKGTMIFNKVHYLEKSSHIFLGPYQKEERNACFQCFYQLLDSNESDLKEIIDFGPNLEIGLDIFTDLLSRIDSEMFINRVMIFNKKTYEYEWKKIRKSPFCKACKDYVEPVSNYKLKMTDFNKFRVKSKKEISSIIKQFEDEMIDWDVGVGKKMFRDAESNIIPMYAIEANINKRKFFSYGRTVDLSGSKNAAILELLERYSSMVPQFKESIYDTYSNLVKKGKQVVHPNKYILHERQSFDREKKMYWSLCTELHTGEQFLIPEQMMYFDNQLLRKEDRYIYETSNGSALGGSLEEAMVYGMLEAVERDCFLVHWYTKKLPKIIDSLSIKNPNVKQLLSVFEQQGYDTYIFDITLETEIPTVWILMRNKNSNANLYLYNAAGAHYDPESAIFAALVEAGTSVIVYEEKLEDEKETLRYLIDHPEEVTRMEDHVNYYAFKENASAFDYILDHIDELETTTLDQMTPGFAFSFKNIFEKVSQHHKEIYYADMSNQLIDEMGLAVVKVFIPTLQPMTFGKQNERLNRRRLESIVGKGKLKVGKDPHPFP